MLERQTRDKFTNNSWSEMIKTEKNSHQFVIRLKSRVDTALEDLALIAKRLPDKEYEKVFNTYRLDEFLESLTLFQNGSEKTSVKRPSNHKINTLLIERGLSELMELMENHYTNLPNLSKVISSKMEETYGIYKDLLDDIERKELEKEAFDKDRLFLFKVSDLVRYENFLPLNQLIINTLEERDQKFADNPHYVRVANVTFGPSNEYVETDLIDTITRKKIGTSSLHIGESSHSLLSLSSSTCMLTISITDKTSINEKLLFERRNNDYLIYKEKPLKLKYNWNPNFS